MGDSPSSQCQTRRRELNVMTEGGQPLREFFLGVGRPAWDRGVRNFAPNVGDDYGGRLLTAWLDR